jgi:hypothetical protein
MSKCMFGKRDGRPGFESRRGQKILLYSTTSRSYLRPIQPPIQWVPKVKQPGREAYHSRLSNAEVKNAWSYTFTPPYTFEIQNRYAMNIIAKYETISRSAIYGTRRFITVLTRVSKTGLVTVCLWTRQTKNGNCALRRICPVVEFEIIQYNLLLSTEALCYKPEGRRFDSR